MKGAQFVRGVAIHGFRFLGEGVGGLFLVLMVLLTTVDVVLRLTLNVAIFGATEFIQVFMVAAAFFGLGSCTLAEKHARADIVVSKLPLRAQRVLDIVNGLCALFFGALLVAGNVGQLQDTAKFGSSTTLLELPLWPLYAAIAFCYLLFALATLGVIARRICRSGSDR